MVCGARTVSGGSGAGTIIQVLCRGGSMNSCGY